MPGEPPVVPTTAGREAGAAAVGGGSGALCTALRDGVTEPVTSPLPVLERNGLASKRWVSELHPTTVAEMDASRAKRNRRSERPGSTTRRIGFPTRTQQTGGQLTTRG